MSSDRVLVVDDNAVNLKLLRFLLEDSGFGVATVREGTEALKIMREIQTARRSARPEHAGGGRP